MSAQQPAPIQRVSVFRPVEYSSLPQWSPEITESALGVFKVVQDALSFDENRISFSLRSPGLGLLASCNMWMTCSFSVSAPARWDFQSSSGPIVQVLDRRNTLNPGLDAVAQAQMALGFAPRLTYGGGDAFFSSVTSASLVINGASVGNQRQNEYAQTLDRVWFGDAAQQRRFHGCGGLPDQHNATAVSGDAYAKAQIAGADAGHNGAGALCVSAYTADTGIAKRVENLYNCTTSIKEAAFGLGAAIQDSRVIQVRIPVRIAGILSAWGPYDEMSDSNPYRSTCLAIPHLNITQIDYLMRGLRANIFRSLSSRSGAQGAGPGTIAANTSGGGFDIKLLSDPKPKLHATFLRLGAFRRIPASISIPCFKISVFDPTSETTPGGVDIVAELTRDGVGLLKNALPCVGMDREAGVLARCAPFNDQIYKECTWNMTSAQCPSYLAFVAQKHSDQYVLGGTQADDAVGKRIVDWDYTRGAVLPANALTTAQVGLQNYFLSRNTNASCCVQRFSLEVQASVGSFIYSGESFPYQVGTAELFRDVLRYSCPSYLNGDINRWKKHCGVVLLGADSFIRGITTVGSAYPLQINATVRFSSAREYIDGTGACGPLANQVGPAVQRDCIYTRPVALQIFDKASLSISPSSAILSSMNISHSASQEILARG